jgi:hypothetical protein
MFRNDGQEWYPYNPYLQRRQPRVSTAWNPRFQNAFLHDLFGDGGTVVRGGYGPHLCGISGDLQVLNPLLCPSRAVPHTTVQQNLQLHQPFSSSEPLTPALPGDSLAASVRERQGAAACPERT